MRQAILFVVAVAGLASSASATDEALQPKVAAAVQSAIKGDERGFANLVATDAKLDVDKQPLEAATIESLRREFDGCTARPLAAKDPADQVTQLWDCKGSPTLAAFNFKDGKIVLVRTLPNFRPISPPSTDRK